MGKILYAYMVPMSETLKAFFFQRLNQDSHMTLVNKCQAFYVKAQNILLGKVADSLIFHANKLRHGEMLQNCCRGAPPYVRTRGSYEGQGFTGAQIAYAGMGFLGTIPTSSSICLTRLCRLWDMGVGGGAETEVALIGESISVNEISS